MTVADAVPPARLVLVGSVLVDIVMFVDHLPPPGGDVLADDSLVTTGGGFNVMSAAQRQGLPAAYAGRHGAGRFGDQVRLNLTTEPIPMLLPATPDGDTGFCVGLVDATGERTYATRQGVDGDLSSADLAALELRDDDLIYVSGYELAYRHGAVLARWFTDLDPSMQTIFDPGPLAADLPTELLEAVLARSDWTSLNAHEAHALSGIDDPELAATWLAEHPAARRGVIVRDGARGCWLSLIKRTSSTETHRPILVPPTKLPSPVIDTSGAGDTHVGAFAAALGRGLDPVQACRWANAAAARCVTAFGPATGPTLEHTYADLAEVATTG